MHQPSHSAATGKIQTAAPLILIVDDTDLYRESIQAVLEAQGYRTCMAKDGLEGLDHFRAQHSKIQLVITDLDMPRMNGIQLLEAIQEVQPAVKVICVSGSPVLLAKVPVESGRIEAVMKSGSFEPLLSQIRSWISV